MAKMARRRYDDKFRASAVVMLQAAGYPDKKGALTKVARHLSIPHATLSRWYNHKRNPAPTDMVHEKKNDMIVELDNLARALVEAMYKEVDENGAPLRELATAFGIVFDKKQLLTGDPTETNNTTIEIRYADADPNPS
jgi:transposase-like protein